MSDNKTNNDTLIHFRNPTVSDGSAVWQLIQDAGTLELNTAYAYLLLCSDFAATSIVAERDGVLLGFVVGYLIPSRPDTVFVWQVGVSGAARGEGVASRLLDRLVLTDGCRGVRYLETTVTPSNKPSRALFASLARRAGAPLEESEGFPETLFPEGEHEAERRLRIGPIDKSKLAG